METEDSGNATLSSAKKESILTQCEVHVVTPSPDGNVQTASDEPSHGSAQDLETSGITDEADVLKSSAAGKDDDDEEEEEEEEEKDDEKESDEGNEMEGMKAETMEESPGTSSRKRKHNTRESQQVVILISCLKCIIFDRV